MKHAGIWVNPKKIDRMGLRELCESASSDDFQFHIISMDENHQITNPVKFDIIVHKFIDTKHCSKQIEATQAYFKKHPNVINVEPFEKMEPFLNRMLQCNMVRDCLRNTPSFENIVYIPNYCEIRSSWSIQEKLAQLDKFQVTFPIICKPLIITNQDVDHDVSNDMCIVFNAENIDDVKVEHYLAQSFLNHDAVLHKINVIGRFYDIAQRPSLKNFHCNNAADQPQKTIFFSTFDVSKFGCDNFLTRLDTNESTMIAQQKTQNTATNTAAKTEENSRKNSTSITEKQRELIANVAQCIRKWTKVDLFNVDMIICKRSSRVAVIDVNYFPGYDKYPTFVHDFSNFIRERFAAATSAASFDSSSTSAPPSDAAAVANASVQSKTCVSSASIAPNHVSNKSAPPVNK